MSFFQQVRSKADEVALEADKALRIQRKQGEIGQLQKQIQLRLSDLGSTTYGLHQNGHTLPAPLLEACRGLDSLLAAIHERQDEIEAIRRETVALAPSISELRCASCGQSLPAGAMFCLHCGARVPAPRPMISCSKCGESLPADARFCANCGQPVVQSPPMPAPADTKAPETAPSTWSCPQCRSEISTDSVFCPECGADLRTSKPSASMTAMESGPQAAQGNESASTPLKCRVCESELMADALFCPICGALVHSTETDDSMAG